MRLMLPRSIPHCPGSRGLHHKSQTRRFFVTLGDTQFVIRPTSADTTVKRREGYQSDLLHHLIVGRLVSDYP
jgi:hypothetical protein